jgi:uncharacterized protein
MSASLWMALGFVLVIEGLTYALVPRKMQGLMRAMLEHEPESLRVIGAIVMAVGVFVIWLVQ